MASEDVQTNLRLPVDLKDRLVVSATENGRSLSAEVAYRLLQTYEKPDIGWDIRVAQHTNETRLETLGSHLLMVQTHINMLLERLRTLRENGATEEEIIGIESTLTEARSEVERLRELRLKHLEESHRLDDLYQRESREIYRVLDVEADIALQDDYRSIVERQEALGLPVHMREQVVKTLEPSSPERIAMESRRKLKAKSRSSPKSKP